MNDKFMGQVVRDRRSGITGRVIGLVTWLDTPPSLIVQPPVRGDHTVPPTVFVTQASADIVPQVNESPLPQ